MSYRPTEADNLVRALIIALVRNGTVTEDELLESSDELREASEAADAACGLAPGEIPELRELSPDIARKLLLVRGR